MLNEHDDILVVLICITIIFLQFNSISTNEILITIL